MNIQITIFQHNTSINSHTVSTAAGVDVENFSTLLTLAFFVTSVVSDNTPQLLEDFATISQLFNLLFSQ